MSVHEEVPRSSVDSEKRDLADDASLAGAVRAAGARLDHERRR
jgi:hypothetical protein